MHLKQIRCADIRPDSVIGADQPLALDELADSIRRHGVLRPVLLHANSEGYVIVHGERRWRAARMLGIEAIPACVVNDFRRDERITA